MWRSWQEATQQALYGPDGFYARGERPAAHFRTSVHASPRYAAAVLALLREVDAALGQPGRLDLADVGAGRGELLTQVLTAAAQDRSLAGRLTGHAVEISPRPPGLDPRIRWGQSLPAGITGLVIASEWLDNVPLDVAELSADGPLLLLVDPVTGAERPGPRLSPADQAWLDRWWPLRARGERAEIGRTRDRAWAGVIQRLTRGLAVAADYSHQRAWRPAGGTLAGYRAGRRVRPVPDGSCDVTAHVALDACAAAGAAAGAGPALLTSQRAALTALGLTGARPPLRLADRDPHRYLAALQRASQEAELIAPDGLGRFGWLIQAVGMPLPASLSGCPPGRLQTAGRGHRGSGRLAVAGGRDARPLEVRHVDVRGLRGRGGTVEGRDVLGPDLVEAEDGVELGLQVRRRVTGDQPGGQRGPADQAAPAGTDGFRVTPGLLVDVPGDARRRDAGVPVRGQEADDRRRVGGEHATGPGTGQDMRLRREVVMAVPGRAEQPGRAVAGDPGEGGPGAGPGTAGRHRAFGEPAAHLAGIAHRQGRGAHRSAGVGRWGETVRHPGEHAQYCHCGGEPARPLGHPARWRRHRVPSRSSELPFAVTLGDRAHKPASDGSAPCYEASYGPLTGPCSKNPEQHVSNIHPSAGQMG